MRLRHHVSSGYLASTNLAGRILVDTLEHYLASDYLAQKQEIAMINRMLVDVGETFSKIFDGTQWPYEFRTDKKREIRPQNDISQGTLAMVLIATGRLLGRCALPKGVFLTPKPKEYKQLKSNWSIGLSALLKDLEDKSESLERPSGVYSSTFGPNNPVTLSHLSELNTLLHNPTFEDAKARLGKETLDAKSILEKHLKDPEGTDLLLEPKPSWRYYTNAFVPLRAIRAACDLEISEKLRLRYRRFFESTLHDQLSFSAIPDSRFDPAELVFCLEGLLLCAREAVDSSLFERVLEVLAEKQNTSAHWRPCKPFLATSAGAIMLPISVEGANSLMRSTVLIDQNRLYDTYTAKSLPLMQRFWAWLRARSVRFERDKVQCVGWHSEHVNDPNLIHIWDTSQVTEFMISFREMLERHIATQSLRLSRLDSKRYPLNQEQKTKSKEELWTTIVEDFEPLLNDDDDQQVYKSIGAEFVKPRETLHAKNYSMLLYGPPGTGKTTVAKNLANILELPLVTVTVSDFLGSGGTNVEARAKAIFQTLEAQDNCVILFDEIDSFLLDRDTELYREQDSLFQFLTPGMLTKINDLRKCERSIFIVATNYANRIDPAIKRTGRIDKQYLVSLPNAARRLKIMENEGLVGTSSEKQKFVNQTALYGYTDLSGSTKDVCGTDGTAIIADVAAKLAEIEPATSLKSYASRFCD